MKTLYWIIILYLAWAAHPLHANVKSTSGNIHFIVSPHSKPIASLSQNGLVIGQGHASSNLNVMGNAVISQRLSIGTTASHSNLNLSGTISMSHNFVSSSQLIGNTSIVLADTSATNITLALPPASNTLGRNITVKKMNLQNQLNITAAGTNIDGFQAVGSLSGNLDHWNFVSNGEQWYILEHSSSPLHDPIEQLSTNTILAWPMDDQQGSLVTDAKGSLTANLSNHHAIAGNSIKGAIHQGLKLDDTDDAIFRASGDVKVNSNAYSWSFWFKPSSSATMTPETNLAAPTRQVLGFSFSSSDPTWQKVGFHKLSNGNYVKVKANSTLSINTWHHVLGVWDTNTFSLYINGSLEGSAPASDIYSQLGHIQLKHPRSQSESTISFDHFMLFNRALTQNDITNLYYMGDRQ